MMDAGREITDILSCPEVCIDTNFVGPCTILLKGAVIMNEWYNGPQDLTVVITDEIQLGLFI